ncbi:SRPBCC family protein [Hymenobacter chitinivorans]|uniref:Polyketide cyclase/dehydrase/lipid transport protein n=1 Tax=Hymenobacter chitinivorans DSM 11115 TaxID=1121954 RepID=A0A2M9BTB2_9BACT|nr:hypothetical protein [Hymenobacter chitinivorans]PJJ61173.1 hypothetical protein CLV45_2611 [Hymenobacter chitinivorans DSM 11115]
MKFLFAIALATAHGLLIRLLFGSASGLMEIMSVTFLFFVPSIIGFLTVILMPARKITTGAEAFFTPWLTSLALLVITILLNMEGAICWLMAFPIFAIAAGVGGIVAYWLRKPKSNDPNANNWQKPNTLNVSLVFIVPLLLGSIEGEKALTPKQMVIEKAVVLNAPAADVWQKLISNKQLGQPADETSFAALLGFPKHVSTTLDTLRVGGTRMAYYEKGLYFKETVTKYQPERLLVLRVDANPNATPAAVMDEHILIGGKHLDILEDVYDLRPLPGGRTRLVLSSRFYINTPFNWYAGIWAHYLMTDILEGELNVLAQPAPMTR